MGLVLLTSVWLVVSLLVVLISTVFLGKQDLRPLRTLLLFVVALGVALLATYF